MVMLLLMLMLHRCRWRSDLADLGDLADLPGRLADFAVVPGRLLADFAAAATHTTSEPSAFCPGPAHEMRHPGPGKGPSNGF